MSKDYDRNSYRGVAIAGDYAQAQSTYGFMSRVYALMSVGLALTGVVAFFVAGSESLTQMFLVNRPVFIVTVLLELGLVFWLSFFIKKMSAATATAGFIAYSVLNGVTMSAIFLIYTQTSIAATFMITAGAFAGLSAFGYLTKRDLGIVGRFAIYALLGIIIASLVNIFFLKSSGFDWVLSIVGVLVFAALTAYDTQKLRELSEEALDRESFGRYAVIGALALYLDFINMFLFLLRLFGGRK